jgi:molybdopterin-synthase adenylyltransferase
MTGSEQDIDRQQLAFGEEGQRLLRSRSVAVVGVSGGGSHVCQQLIYAGIGTIVPFDEQNVEATNLRRLVGAATRDIEDHTPKVAVPTRMALEVCPAVTVRPVKASFPNGDSISELSLVDLIIGCVDNDASKSDLNNFAIEQAIPYIDIGATIIPQKTGSGFSAHGQIACIWPGGPCLRCMGVISESSIALGHERRMGYGSNLPDPQVVSINGTLASEAVTAALLYFTLGWKQPERRRYLLPPGELRRPTMTVETACSFCGFRGVMGHRR